MSYLPLARKYRPSRFEELVGQEGTMQALANGIKIGREPHAIIFAGVRGIGKTTLARLYAKALNCVTGPTPTPCGTCENCVAVASGTHEDVLEIDGASHTGVDDVRLLRETLGYVPQRSKFKVYIIDEVHMLSNSAFNALLKPLEEPPGHIVFIFATTELHRIPQTVVSRCQTFHLKKFSISTIQDRIKYILQQENIAFDEAAVAIIAREGKGSMRDALTLLDQVVAFGGQQVSLQALRNVISFISNEQYLGLIEAALQQNGERVLELIAQLDREGADFTTVTEELAGLIRHAFIVRDVGLQSMNLAWTGMTADELNVLHKIAMAANPLDLNRLFRTMMKCRRDLDGSGLDKFVIENYLLEWCLDPGLPDVRQLMAALQGNGQLSSENTKPPASVATASAAPPRASVLDEQRPIERASAAATPKVLPDSWREMLDIWRRIKPLQARLIEEAHMLEYGPRKICLAVQEKTLAGSKLLQRDTQEKLRQQFVEVFGFAGTLEIVPHVAPAEKSVAAVQTPDAAVSVPPVKPPEPIMPLNVHEERKQEAASRKQSAVESARNASLTLDTLSVFGGTIEQIQHLDKSPK